MKKESSIDEIDAKILKFLLKDSRMSFTEIGRACDITVAAVRARYKNLWKLGVINGEIMQVNPLSLGYNCVCDIGIMTSPDREKQIRELLKGELYVTHVFGPFGKYDVGAKIVLHDTNKLADVIAHIESHTQVRQTAVFIWAETVNIDHTENLVIPPLFNENKKDYAQQIISIPKEQGKIDEIDRQIARILVKNSRMPFRKIGSQLGISVKSVIQRYKKLRKNVLTISSITVNLKKIGYNAMAHAFIKVTNRSKTEEVHAQLLQIPNLIVTVKYIGIYDLLAIVALADFEDFFSVSEKIRRIPNIEQSDIYLRPTFESWPLNLFATLL
ncbi:MAG: AsnC family transcriptional regulator [Candidatus Bathyarchaeia archaeon]